MCLLLLTSCISHPVIPHLALAFWEKAIKTPFYQVSLSSEVWRVWWDFCILRWILGHPAIGRDARQGHVCWDTQETAICYLIPRHRAVAICKLRKVWVVEPNSHCDDYERLLLTIYMMLFYVIFPTFLCYLFFC